MINRLFSKALALCLGLASLAWIAAAGAAARADELAFASDLTREAAISQTRQIPVLILFTAPNCAYCEQVKQEFLLPMQRNPEYADKVIFRQVDMQSQRKLVDFSGNVTTHARFCKQHKIKLTPTIKLFDAAGNSLIEPLVGLSTPDFYGAYLDAAIDQALEKIRSPTRP
ncbi:MAG: thioredoxin family protein [Sulfurimicrobium sp.]|nr:thioredoxin family protein [Sulfurimicrobium sp.]